VSDRLADAKGSCCGAECCPPSARRGAIGLAVLGTVAWTVVANSLRTRASYGHALAAGFSRAFLGGGLIMLLALAVAVIAIRVRRADLAGASEPAAEQPDLAPGSRGSDRGQQAVTGSQPQQPSTER
jgi:hypothetical protein